MNAKLQKCINSTKGFLTKHSPEILTGIGVTGMIASTVMAVKATPKAMILLEEAKMEKGEDLKPVEVVKAAWKPYIPALVTGVISASCIIGASTVSYKRNAALATAYTITEKTLVRYRDKVIETIGEKKEKEIRDKVSQDEVNEKPVSNTQVIITGKGKSLLMDKMTGRYFYSDIDTIKRTVNELNRQMNYQDYVSLNEFYYAIGLEGIKTGDDIGWNVSRGLIELDFGTCLTENDEACITIDYAVIPKYGFDMC